ncbi:hypothetical protein SAMN05421878_102106 [Actinobaculum suis]|uniref:Uncharacterized protein n=1 Tax=Actinobaculum suis TaxID=1657 RepID=A0A1G7A9Q8_9ACTO|nr:hypothetical protein SAMN05421878_102106 [Actinobaculum suis]VDG75388.1 Uncharacterised protein [Actinobaculum suis]
MVNAERLASVVPSPAPPENVEIRYGDQTPQEKPVTDMPSKQAGQGPEDAYVR